MLQNLSEWATKYACLPNSVNAWRQISGEKRPKEFLIKSDKEISVLYIDGYSFEVQSKHGKTAMLYSENLDRKIEIERKELFRLELDREKFSQSVANAIELTQNVVSLANCDGYYLGGRQLGRKKYSIFLLFDAQNAQYEISKYGDSIPVVFVLSDAMITKDNARWIAKHEGVYFELHNAFILDDGNITNTQSIADIVGFGGTLDIPDTQLAKWTKRRPANPKWQHIKITLEDPDYLFIRFGPYSDNIHYGQFPTFTRKGGKIKQRNKLWWFLLKLSQDTEYDHEAHKNYLSKLRKFFKDFFEIYDTDPLPIIDGCIDPQFTIEVSEHILSDVGRNF